MQDKKEYRSAVRSRRLIREAFVDLLREKELNKVTVTDIVNRADVNRSTFYAHYPDVRGLVEEIENEIVSDTIDILESLKSQNIYDTPQLFLMGVHKCLEKNQDFYKVLVCSQSSEPFMEKIKGVFIDYIKAAEEIPKEIKTSQSFMIKLNFCVGGIINVYQQWFMGELGSSLEKISYELSDVIENSMRSFFEYEVQS